MEYIKKLKTYLLYLFCFGCDVVACIPFTFLYLIYGNNFYFEKKSMVLKKYYPGNWCFTFDLKDGVLSFWKYRAITIGPHFIIYRHGIRKKGIWCSTQEHEHFHSEQYESLCLVGSFVSLLFSNLLLFILIYCLFAYICIGSGYVTAWLRNEKFYRGSHFEEGAHAIDDKYE